MWQVNKVKLLSKSIRKRKTNIKVYNAQTMKWTLNYISRTIVKCVRFCDIATQTTSRCQRKLI